MLGASRSRGAGFFQTLGLAGSRPGFERASVRSSLGLASEVWLCIVGHGISPLDSADSASWPASKKARLPHWRVEVMFIITYLLGSPCNSYTFQAS